MTSPTQVLAALLALALSGSGCASMSNRAKTIGLMGSSALAVGAVGAISTPGGESVPAHAALWGGLAAATAGVIGLFVFDEEALRKEAQAKTLKLEKELAAYHEQSEPELVGSNQLGLAKTLPERFRGLITPGEWSLYRIDRWTNSGENELVHQDMIFRFHQPQLNPSGRLLNNEEGGK